MLPEDSMIDPESVIANLLKSLLMVVAVLIALRISYTIRARAMRALADRWGFRYVGPEAPPVWWYNPLSRTPRPPIPAWISHLNLRGQPTQIWNVIDGEKNGIPVVIFDVIVGEFRGSHACTVIACQTEEDPFVLVASVDRVVQSRGWTVLNGGWFLRFSWTMRVKRVDHHLSEANPGNKALELS
jgi:hypothetical protein